MISKRSRLDSILLAVGLSSLTMLTSCGRMGPEDLAVADPVRSEASARVERGDGGGRGDLLGWLQYRPERISARTMTSLRPELRRDFEKSKLAMAFGLEHAQPMDLGVYGKIGTSTVFIASRRHIPDYDRLYWVMIRVLSEKYGCFIRRKFPHQNQIGFECRDRRTIVMQRELSENFVKFVGWQFDRKGQEVVIRKPKTVASKAKP